MSGPEHGHGGRRRWLVRGAMGLGVAAAAAAIVWSRDSTPPLTPGALEAARAAFERSGLADYDLTLWNELDAQDPQRVQLEVRGGKTVRLLVGGAEVPARESFSVPGLFDTLERELEMATEPNPLPGQPRGAILKARFHEVWGFPLVVKRIASERKSYVISLARFDAPARGLHWVR